jgi:hypothetical protein
MGGKPNHKKNEPVFKVSLAGASEKRNSASWGKNESESGTLFFPVILPGCTEFAHFSWSKGEKFQASLKFYPVPEGHCFCRIFSCAFAPARLQGGRWCGFRPPAGSLDPGWILRHDLGDFAQVLDFSAVEQSAKLPEVKPTVSRHRRNDRTRPAAQPRCAALRK